MDTAHDPAFGILLRRYREAAGLTQEDLAERAEMSVRGLVYLERGERRPYPHTVQRLATALDLGPPERATFADAARPGRSSAHPQASAPSHTPVAGVLPSPLTPLVGREREVAALSALLQRADVRLLTFIGPGGVGKTRLAVQVASTLRDLFAQGVVFVPLAALHDPDLVAATLAQALGLR